MNRAVSLVCCWLLDPDGKNLTYGGSQRYTLELASLFRSEGWRTRIIQKARVAFSSEVDGVPVCGVPAAQTWWGMRHFSRQVAAMMNGEELAVYVYMEAAYPKSHAHSIVVQHGLSWSGDDRSRSFFNTFGLQPRLVRDVDAVVCVDTAYINWLHAQIPGRRRYAEKLWYIPNFVNLSEYSMCAKWVDDENERIVLCPRRLYPHRGPMLLLEAMKQLWKLGRRYRLVFCGGGALAEAIREEARRIGESDRVSVYERSFREMPAEYARSQVSVIPTIAFEGTSLSCLEAMAAGTPVVVTHIGGLANLVIPGHNGLCVDLRASDLASAIDFVLSDPVVWDQLSEKGRLTAESLDITAWRRAWQRVIRAVSQTNRKGDAYRIKFN